MSKNIDIFRFLNDHPGPKKKREADTATLFGIEPYETDHFWLLGALESVKDDAPGQHIIRDMNILSMEYTGEFLFEG